MMGYYIYAQFLSYWILNLNDRRHIDKSLLIGVLIEQIYSLETL